MASTSSHVDTVLLRSFNLLYDPNWVQGCLIVQRIIALDMEGVITPEIWIAVAGRTGLPELQLTTRDEPDYQKLMNHRISVLAQHDIGLNLIQEVI